MTYPKKGSTLQPLGRFLGFRDLVRKTMASYTGGCKEHDCTCTYPSYEDVGFKLITLNPECP